MCFIIRHGKRLGETLKLSRELQGLCQAASVSEAATSRLGLISDKILNVSVSAQKISCTSLLRGKTIHAVRFLNR